MSTKTYKTRDSATSALRKLGVPATEYSKFIVKIGNQFVVDLAAVNLYLKPKTKTKVGTGQKNKVEPKPVRQSISKIIQDMILDGMTNQEIWDVLETKYGLDDSKRYYPAWNRAEMRRTGKLVG